MKLGRLPPTPLFLSFGPGQQAWFMVIENKSVDNSRLPRAPAPCLPPGCPLQSKSK